ncbi:MAG: accessory gene regulator ArgB-like protein [Halanaerobiaceae bacterium]
MYRKIINLLTEYISNLNNVPAKKRDNIRFGLEILASAIFSTFISLGTAALLGIFTPVFTVLLASALLKSVAGGIHLDSPVWCSLFTCSIFNLLGYISIKMATFPEIILLLLTVSVALTSLLFLYLWSPADNEKKPITDPKKIRLLKIISLIIASIYIILSIITLYFLPQSFYPPGISLVMTLFLQSLTVTPVFYRIQEYLNKLKLPLQSIITPGKEVKE